jgi:hypothetical protein
MSRAIEREFEALEAEISEARWDARHAAGGAGGDRGGGSRDRAAEAARRRDAHRSALAKLRPPPPTASSAGTLLAAGAASGAALCVLVNVCVLLRQAHAHAPAAAHVAALLPVLRGPLLALAHMALCVRVRRCALANERLRALVS